jgi:hypothetical protein
MDCLSNLIGLTDRTCDCWDDSKPETWADVNASDSGLFVTDPEYGYEALDRIFANADCGDGSIWDLLQRSRTKAISNFVTDLGAQIQSLYKNRAQFAGTIGRPNASRVEPRGQEYIGMILYPRLLQGAKFIVTHIHIGTNFSGDVDVVLTSNNGDYFTPVTTTITGIANRFVRAAVDTPIELPFYSAYREGDLRYYAYYSTAGGTIQPLGNSFYCCGGKSKHEKFLKAGGFGVDTLTDLGEVTAKGSGANGLSLEGYLYCSGVDWLCDLDTIGGYSLKMVVARAIQMKAAALLYSMDNDSTRINRFTEPSSGNIDRMIRLNELYFNQIVWISQNLPVSAVDCLLCNDTATGRIQKKALIV